ncbi:MAG: TlyA family RNA methyltransferase [Methylobacterium sp.]|nr:TlyA family RNA methyltransferase [Methylobacterium sp.]MCA3655564.1 TlyA family RNA methyltransferase [Methylobacterium sp.]MCA3658177.1 TlyA family RNA methyltransferase [Methylobacterium sp.]MCA3661797.1 TlyA family RNA methyltransferase [Methylobacterium sp.]MCA3662478.1 TlyA family RNA methyltransferase [Methylobacterium sp.]
MNRQRIDQLLVERGVFASRALARAAIEAGLVRADGLVVDKPSRSVPADAQLQASRPFETVSRGGVKLLAALDAFGVLPADRIALDLGASTGGFTDALLSRGARRVYAVDVGHGQLHPRLAADARVVALEGLDARAITASEISEMVSLLVADLSFIGLVKALPAGLARLEAGGDLIALIKPQFEAGPGASKDGVIRDPSLQREIASRVAGEVAALGLAILGLIPSPIAGGDGNREFLLHARKPA